MIVIDSSAVIAVLLFEPDAPELLQAILQDGAPVMSVATVLECSIVARSTRRLSAAESETALDQMMSDLGVSIMDVTNYDLTLARAAHVRFGKGTGHSAQLNFGDCFSYALAKRLGAPLLYKGSDFAHIDIVSAL